MKKIITRLSTKTFIKCLVVLAILTQHTTSVLPKLSASANSENHETSILNPVLDLEVAEDAVIPDIPTEKFQFSTELIIKAINPGYTVDGVRDVGELIELQKTTDTPLSLAGYLLRYTNSSGKQTTLFNFSDGSSMAGEFLLLRLARTANSTEADASYMTTIAMDNAKLELLYRDQVVDSVCWGKAEDCVDAFSSKAPTTLVRSVESGDFVHLESYDTHFDAEHPSILAPVADETPEPSVLPSDLEDPGLADATMPSLVSCRGVEFAEILSYYTNDTNEQFIELYNAKDEDITISACTLRYKKKTYPLSGTIKADGYIAVYPSQLESSFTLTKNPSSSNSVELLDADGTVLDILVYAHGQKKGVSYAKFIDATGAELWDFTYANTPGDTNVYQEFRTCPAGKVINPATGNCITITVTSSTAECPAGKYRNPLTGRCKNIESTTSELKPCAEGYERNPETNRCRKIKAENDGAGYALVPTTYSGKSTFVALGIVVLLVLLGTIYIILQFRHEIARTARKARQRLHHIRKDLVARGISFHRHKKP